MENLIFLISPIFHFQFHTYTLLIQLIAYFKYIYTYIDHPQLLKLYLTEQ